MQKLSGTMKLNVHNAVEWVTADELKNYKFMPADAEFVEKIMAEA